MTLFVVIQVPWIFPMSDLTGGGSAAFAGGGCFWSPPGVANDDTGRHIISSNKNLFMVDLPRTSEPRFHVKFAA
jgi:hypothetical protein